MGSCNFVPPPPSSANSECPNGACALMKKKDTCPNSDPGFDKLLSDLKISDGTPETRSKLFIVCVIVRTLLYSGVYLYRDEPWMPYIVGVLALASIFQLTRPTENRQWWSKKFQLIMAILVLASALAVKFANFDSRSMAVLLFTSLIGGIIQRTKTTLC